MVKKFTEPAHFVLPESVLAETHGLVTRKMLFDFLPVKGDFFLRVLVPDHDGHNDDAYLWHDVVSDNEPLVAVGNVISVRCLPAAGMVSNVEGQHSAACNMTSSEFMSSSSTGSEITDKMGEALETLREDSKKTFKKIGKGLKAFGALFKMKPASFAVE